MNKEHVTMNWKKIRHSCGNIAFALLIAGFCSIPLAGAPSCAINHAVTGGVAIIAMISAVLAAVGNRFWVLIGSIVLFVLAPLFMCI